MSRGGQNRKPVELKLLKGTLRPSRERAKHPKPLTSPPPCPKWLSPIARTEWKRIVPELLRIGILSRIDMAALAAYCENYAILTQCTNYIRRKGGYSRYLSGKNSQTAPHITAMNKAFSNIRVFCAEFGMTPSSRGRMEAPKEGESEDEDLD